MSDIDVVRNFIIGMQTYFIRTDTGQSGEMPASISALAAFDRLRTNLAASNARVEALQAENNRLADDLDATGDENRRLLRDVEASNARVAELETLINTPQTNEWFEAVGFEAAHQIERWGNAHDAGKTPMDWFWLIGFLAQKAAMAEIQGDIDKAKHHTISTGAVMLNWFRALTGESNAMRPGIEAPTEDDEK